MKRSAAEILREYGPFPGVDRVNGVTFDGQNVWFAAGDTLHAFDPASGKPLRSIDVAAHAGTIAIPQDRVAPILALVATLVIHDMHGASPQDIGVTVLAAIASSIAIMAVLLGRPCRRPCME